MHDHDGRCDRDIMTPTNLILIDGIPGSGKSSTVHRLGLHLQRLGYDARWFFEAEAHHPIYPVLEAQELPATESFDTAERNKMRERILLHWKTLTASLQGTEQIVILDSSFSQTPAQHQQLWNQPPEETLAHVLEVERILEPIDPVLIYLYQRDVGAALKEILAPRSPGYADFLVQQLKMTPYGRVHGIQDYDGVIAAYLGIRRVTDRIFDKLRMRKLAIENSAGDWKRYNDAITDFLGLSPIEPPFALPRDTEMLVGKYCRVGSTDVFAVATDGPALCICGSARLRLIPETKLVFHVEGTRAVLKFEIDERGIAGAVEVFEAAPPGLPSIWRRI
jgi:thymidylate kinase